MNQAQVNKKKKLLGMTIALFWVSLALYFYREAEIKTSKVNEHLPVVIMSKEGGL